MVAILRAVPELHRQKTWEAEGASCLTGLVAGRYGVARRTAKRWVRVGLCLEHLPEIRSAHEGGWISFDQLAVITTFATPETDADLARRGGRLSLQSLYREARSTRRLSDRQATDAHARRGIHVTCDAESGITYMEVTLPGEQGRAVAQALEEEARELPLDPSASDPQAARMADALERRVLSTSGDVAPGPHRCPARPGGDPDRGPEGPGSRRGERGRERAGGPDEGP
jgi:hypothetical protein